MTTPIILRTGSLVISFGLALVGCGGGGTSPEERACAAADSAAFDLCDQNNATEVMNIANALSGCGIFVTEQEVVEASPGDLKAQCLAEGAAEGSTDADADEFIALLDQAMSCDQLVAALNSACSE